MQILLEKEGYLVLSTADAPRGIELYIEQRPDIVLLDLGLPSMNGLEVLRKIRRIDGHAKVIVVTGHGSDESAEVAQRYGACAFVQKPFDNTQFLEILRSAVEARRDYHKDV